MGVTKPAEPKNALEQASAASLSVLPVEQVCEHPRNPRHHAVADDELVESIRAQGLLQPIVVARHPEGSDPTDGSPRYILIAGHRRLDGVKKAGGDHVTALIRHDLKDEADQVAAMLVENGRRRDLTPMEEAEGYGQLRFEFGWKSADIAAAAGHTTSTVNNRLKLLKLDKKVQASVDDGQLNIEDAITISALPVKDQRKLSQSAGTPSFKHDLAQVKSRIKKQAAAEQQIRELNEQGVPVVELPKGVDRWRLNHADHGMTPLHDTYSRDPDDHRTQGCLAYYTFKGYSGCDEVGFVCTNVPAHDEQLDEDRRKRRQEEEARRAADEAEIEARKIARKLRADAIADSIPGYIGAKVPDIVVDLLRVATPLLITELYNDQVTYYTDLMELADDKVWRLTAYNRVADDVTLIDEHLSEVTGGTVADLLVAFTAALAALVEDKVLDHDAPIASWNKAMFTRHASAWLDLAEKCGHHPTDVDAELRAAVDGVSEDGAA